MVQKGFKKIVKIFQTPESIGLIGLTCLTMMMVALVGSGVIKLIFPLESELIIFMPLIMTGMSV